MITHEQIRAGRALLDITQERLATLSGVSTVSIKNIERGNTDARDSTLRAIATALTANGVEFTNGGQPGVRLRMIGEGDPVQFRKGVRTPLSFGLTDESVGVVRRVYELPANGWRADVDFSGRDVVGIDVSQFRRMQVIPKQS